MRRISSEERDFYKGELLSKGYSTINSELFVKKFKDYRIEFTISKTAIVFVTVVYEAQTPSKSVFIPINNKLIKITKLERNIKYIIKRLKRL